MNANHDCNAFDITDFSNCGFVPAFLVDSFLLKINAFSTLDKKQKMSSFKFLISFWLTGIIVGICTIKLIDANANCMDVFLNLLNF